MPAKKNTGLPADLDQPLLLSAAPSHSFKGESAGRPHQPLPGNASHEHGSHIQAASVRFKSILPAHTSEQAGQERKSTARTSARNSGSRTRSFNFKSNCIPDPPKRIPCTANAPALRTGQRRVKFSHQ